ncbi:hypothetical protein COK01_02225 [Priestia megaterium]|uniref:hypothetical protein n=1 Tax=Priestia megaterium TaxID=1404 RepID=UPI000BF34CFF|nr:hypothetical protein [Priestia megaterium]PFP52047.1 hypothetical protein COK01_02225 [Priestia megaterium]
MKKILGSSLLGLALFVGGVGGVNAQTSQNGDPNQSAKENKAEFNSSFQQLINTKNDVVVQAASLSVSPSSQTVTTSKDANITIVHGFTAKPFSGSIKWGDGDVDTIQTTSQSTWPASHRYTSKGTFKISVTFYDANGVGKVGSASVTVK